jgi:hypothetical protein
VGIKPVLVMVAAGALSAPMGAPGTTLRGSPASMARQHHVAVARDYTFARSADEVRRLAALGKLVPLRGNADYRLANVAHPYARPQVRTLLERLAPAYRRACGEALVITSLTRAQSEQPPNAHKFSVHPAGMAVDLRISRSAKCRRWLESRLLELEGKGEVDATREKRPPHYHVAVLMRAPRVNDAAPVRRPPSAAAAPKVLPPDPPVMEAAPPAARPAPVSGTAFATLLAALASGVLLLMLVGWCSIRGLSNCPRP